METSTRPKRGRKLGQIGKNTARAIALVDAGQVTPYAAAKACGIHPATIYEALKRRRERAALQCSAADSGQPAAQDIKNGGSNAE